MKYMIRRTSLPSDYKPHPDAIEEEYIYLDYRSVSTIKEAKTKAWFNDWYNRGINHREQNGMVVCDVKYHQGEKPFTRWVIKIKDLFSWVEALKEQVILKPRSFDHALDPLPEIEIYDDYYE